MEPKASTKASQRPSLLLNTLPLSLNVTIGHKCSIGFISGEQGGQQSLLNIRRWLAASQALVLRDLCTAAPSCWNLNRDALTKKNEKSVFWGCLSYLGRINRLAEARMAWYPVELTFGGHLFRMISPLPFIPAHTMTPSARWTWGMTYFARNLLSVFCFQHRTRPPGRTRNNFSSEKMIFFHWDWFHLPYLLANSRRSRLCLSLNSGLLTALLLTYPFSFKRRLTVSWDGLGGI